MSKTDWLAPINADAGKLKREAVKRRKLFQEISVLKSEVAEYVESGWEVDRELKIKTKLKKTDRSRRTS